jgi:predicted unusual protein kinase regulating ubiquinone biosynthesis (AarF/ABC1/UbiB family)
VSIRHFTPMALHQLRHARKGPLPIEELARPLRRTFQDLGGTFMKFGQVIASSPGLFGEALADEFRSCLDTGATVPFAEVRERIEEELGMALEDAFAEVDPLPIGRASMAVVYRGRLHDGRLVAIKVLRPGIENLVGVDLDLLQPFLEILARQTGDQVAGSLLQVFDGFREQIGEELDLRNEARAMDRFHRLLDRVDLPLVVVPGVVPELSGAGVLTMDLLDGVPIDDLSQVADLGYDPAPLVAQLVQAFFLTTVRWGIFHGDVHAGNLLLLRDGRIGVLDWGIVGRLDPETHRFFRRLLEGALGDESAWTEIAAHLVRTYGPVFTDGLGLAEQDVGAFVQNMVEPVLMRPFGEVSLGQVLAAPQAQAARARGVEAHNRSLRAVVGRLRAQRRLRRLAEASGGIASDFDRGAFLLGKQLLYFERYGKLFLADQPILADPALLTRMLAESGPEPEGGGQ